MNISERKYSMSLKSFVSSRSIAFALTVLLVMPIPVRSQLTEAALKGIVTDASGNVIAASPVVAKNEDTGQARSTVTDDSGTFLLAALSPGLYTVNVSRPGFRTFEQRSLR